jgi:hypothetical protein
MERGDRSWTVIGAIAIVLRLIFFEALAFYYFKVGSFNIV